MHSHGVIPFLCSLIHLTLGCNTKIPELQRKPPRTHYSESGGVSWFTLNAIFTLQFVSKLKAPVLVLIHSWFEFWLITFDAHLWLISFEFGFKVKASPTNPNTAHFYHSLFPSCIYSSIIISMHSIHLFIQASVLMSINSSFHVVISCVSSFINSELQYCCWHWSALQIPCFPHHFIHDPPFLTDARKVEWRNRVGWECWSSAR